ncbi:hypothetical protein JI739_09755 [Ramlibacter sp. AW1]|uniref:BP74 N-terminal domain-containing protein n=1 Tax=Ramlibacter aurantiacus TaxID=2801330 RepID=A0A936ZGR6_9BURK|nr:hypothetical protein [Ramlibacter aurantiacus]MBL0420627.1 hypothetical protein [Ramlibacter aurantiacus]
MVHSFRVWLIGASLLLSACGGGFVYYSDFDFDDPGEAHAFFVFRLRGHGPEQEFRVLARSAEFVRGARAELRLPPSERRSTVEGQVVPGSAGFNAPWSWHLEDVRLIHPLPQAFCDGLPTEVQARLTEWVERIQRFCPSAAFVWSEG